ncbi:solute carrier family 2, facilitated glucose transporter member 5-like [Styela clava]|uniref:solute carrier family 2, facilitated glucose transporter member 5-like n=1 Tax=Styela clava TaxID=7725 RepID=UPI00193935CD|nr:solute carrier family 2, facilitated glucose transporter member 5-like [Styela clava]
MGEEALVANGGDYGNPKPKATLSLMVGVAMAVIGSSFQYGYNIAVVNAPADEIKDFFFGPLEVEVINNTVVSSGNISTSSLNETIGSTTMSPDVSVKKEPVNDDHEIYRDNMYALAVSAFAFTGMIGSLLVGPVVRKFGRRGGLMVNNIISLVAAAFLGFSKLANSFPMIVIGRALIGVFAGLATGVVPMYIGEISPKEWRGAIGVLNQLLITIGILVAQLFGLQGVMGTSEMWPWLFAFTAVPSILQMISIPFMPKSPRYLLIDQHKEDEARNVLVKLRGTDNVVNEMDDMRQEAESEASAGQLTIVQLFRDRSVRWQLITVLFLMVSQQLSGINAVFFYSNKIFTNAGIPPGNQQDLASVGVGTVNVLMTIVSVGIIEWAGRKSLLVWGFGMMIFWCIAMTVVLNLMLAFGGWISYLSIACVIGYIVGFAIGPGPIPWLVTAELFRQAARPPAFMISCMVNWGCNFIIGISFPAVIKVTGPWVFLIFMVVCTCATVFLALVLPETKGKTFNEISDLFAKRNGMKPGGARRDESLKIPLKDMGVTADGSDPAAGDRV